MIEPIRVPPSPSMRQWAQEHGYSSELVARWAAFYPEPIELVRAMQQPPPTYIRANPLRGDPFVTRKRLEGKGFELEDTPLADTWRVLAAPISVGATEEYLLGLYHPQDLSSQLAVLALDPQPGERVADLAAAPGGKTIQAVQAMENRGVVHAFEIDERRAKGLRSNLGRTGARGVLVHARPGQDVVRLQAPFDRVLLDAPCTGEGVIQRDPTRKRGSLQEFQACAAEQGALLDAAVEALRPGGTLVYSTCTLAPEENELQLERAIHRHALTVQPMPVLDGLRLGSHELLPGLTRVGGQDLDASVANARHALPHLHGCLGFFVARLVKEEAS